MCQLLKRNNTLLNADYVLDFNGKTNFVNFKVSSCCAISLAWYVQH